MNRTLLITLLASCIIFFSNATTAGSSTKENNTTNTSQIDKRFNGWSVSFNGGIGILDGDSRHKSSRSLPGGNVNFAFLAQVDYMINPYWGIGLEYGFSPMSGYMTQEGAGKEYNFRTSANDINLVANINLLNLFNSYRKNIRWNLYLNVGYGLSIYSTEKNYLSGEVTTIKNRLSSIIPVGASVEYEATRWLGVFFDFKYKLYTVDDLDGYGASTFSRANDNMIYAGLGLRYKIVGPKKKNYYHMRDISPSMRNPIPVNALSAELRNQLDQTDKKIDRLEEAVDKTLPAEIEKTNEEVAKANANIAALQQANTTLQENDQTLLKEIEDLKAELAKRPARGTTTTHTTTTTTTTVTTTPYDKPILKPIVTTRAEVPAQPKQPAQPAQPIEQATQPTQTTQTTQQAAQPRFSIPSIYYGLNAYRLSEYGTMIVADIANKMYNNPETNLEILSYCDNSGDVEYNNRLSNLRAETIRNLLVEEFGIDASRIVVTNKGKTVGAKDKFMGNRRCDFILK